MQQSKLLWNPFCLQKAFKVGFLLRLSSLCCWNSIVRVWKRGDFSHKVIVDKIFSSKSIIIESIKGVRSSFPRTRLLPVDRRLSSLAFLKIHSKVSWNSTLWEFCAVSTKEIRSFLSKVVQNSTLCATQNRMANLRHILRLCIKRIHRRQEFFETSFRSNR